MDKEFLFLIFLTFLIITLICGIFWAQKVYKERKIYRLVCESSMVSPEEFFKLRKNSNMRGITGVYILHNCSKDMYYVGQGKDVSQRINAHLTGHGNGDVYADYKYGDEFTVQLIPLINSGYTSLNALERDTIKVYNAYSKGYNKTRGNS